MKTFVERGQLPQNFTPEFRRKLSHASSGRTCRITEGDRAILSPDFDDCRINA